jgi:hypothetical protein
VTAGRSAPSREEFLLKFRTNIQRCLMKSYPHTKRQHRINAPRSLGGKSGRFDRSQGGNALFTASFDHAEECQCVVSVERVGKEQLYETDIAQFESHRFVLAKPCSQRCLA